MIKKTISVIVPIWNVEKYISSCIDSIQKQTYSALDIILIDDGSPDRCGMIADDFAMKDRRIRVIHQENRGLSVARNIGMTIANGDLITFVDGDDWIEPQCLEYLCDMLKKSSAQIAVCGMNEKRQKHVDIVLKREKALETLFYQKLFDTSACGKLYYTEQAKKLLFPKNKIFEDLATTYKRIWQAERTAISTQNLYHYRKNKSSIMHMSFESRRFDELDVADELYAFSYILSKDIKKAALCRKFACYCQTLLAMPDNKLQYVEERNRIWSFIRESRYAILGDLKARYKNRIAALLSYLGEDIFRMAWRLANYE